MTPKWLSDTITGFGRRFGLKAFELNAQGVAAVAFEDGTRFALECSAERVYAVLEFPAERPSMETLKALLTEAHPLRSGAFPVRAAYRAQTGMLMLVTSLATDQVDDPTLGAVFEELWKRFAQVRRTLWA